MPIRPGPHLARLSSLASSVEHENDAQMSEEAAPDLPCVTRLAEFIPDIVVTFSLSGKVLSANSSLERCLGYRLVDILGKRLESLPILPRTETAAYAAVLRRVLGGEEVPRFQTILGHANGTRHRGRCFINTIKSDSKPVAVIAIWGMTDDEAETERALLESRRRLETLMGNLPGMAYRCKNDPDWTMTFVSKGCYPLTGYTATQLIDSSEITYAELIHEDDRTLVWDVVQAGVDAKRPFQMQYRIRTADGREKWVWEQGRGVLDEHGKLEALEGLIMDISDRKHAEEALRRSEENYRLLVEDLNDVIYEINLDGEIVYISPVIEEVAGYTVNEMLESNIFDHILPEDHERIHERLEAVLRGEREPTEYRVRAKDGSVRWVRSFSRRFFHDGRLAGLRGMLTDITDWQQAQLDLNESRRFVAETLTPAARWRHLSLTVTTRSPTGIVPARH